jgi:saccharopine dehydrogenase-like NADP-dependent oxidoreductase
MKHVVLLGAGRVGAVMARDLAPDFKVTLVDLRADLLAAMKSAGITTRQADLRSAEAVRSVIHDADIVVGAVPGFMGFETMRTVLAAGKNMVDISFFAEDPFELDELARSKGVIALMDCGVAPGCGNIILGHMEANWDTVERWECLVGGLPMIRTWPYEYKAAFSPIDVIEEYTRPARYVEHGVLMTRPALSDAELVDFPGVGTLEAFNTDGLRTLIRTSKAPFKKEKTLRYPGHIEKMRMLRETGFLSQIPIEINGVAVVPLELTCRLLFPHWQMQQGEADFTVMRVTVKGVTQGSPITVTYNLLDRYDAASDTTSMARTTGYTCTAVVRALAAGLYTHKGISPPEYLGRAGCWNFIQDELAKREVIVSEEIS